MELSRPSQLLAEINKQFPGLWRVLDARRITRKKLWPDWCFIPISEVIACLPINGRDEKALVKAAAMGAHLTALYTWRMTQGIYRIDPEVMEALGAMPLDMDIPDEVLYRLPEWCVYIDFSHIKEERDKIHGIFVHLEHDLITEETELRFLADTDEQCVPIPIHLGYGSLAKALERTRIIAEDNARRLGVGSIQDNEEIYWQKLQQAVGAWLNFVLYLASINADYDNNTAPTRPSPEPVKTKKGLRYFPPERPRIWDVGLREGAALRSVKVKISNTSSSETTGSSRAPVRPHIRRAHWHLYRVGQGRSGQALKWIAPVLVGGGQPEDRPAVIRHV